MQLRRVDPGIPIPPRTPGRPQMLPWAEMKIGDSAFIAGRKITEVSPAAVSYQRHHPDYRFTCRTVTENGVLGVRVWRIEKPPSLS